MIAIGCADHRSPVFNTKQRLASRTFTRRSKPCKAGRNGVPVGPMTQPYPQLEGKMRYFLCVMGMVMIIEGLPYFGWPEKMKPWLKKIMDTDDGDLRKIGAVLVAAGLLLVYLGRS
jgi:hypothetical protein